VTLEALADTDNLNHKIATSGGDSFLLRAHRSGRHDRNALESEAVWLEHLHGQGVSVQRPVAFENGKLILEHDGVFYSLLSWLQGEVHEFLDETQAKLSGQLMAKLHLIARDFTPPPGFSRPVYDAAHFEITLKRLQAIPWLESDWPMLEQSVRVVQQEFQPGEQPWTLIHTDFHAGNLVFNSARVSAIDFGLCGFGPEAFDIATALFFLETERLQTPFLQGYGEVIPLGPDVETRLRPYTLAAWLENIAHLAPRPQEREFLETVLLPEFRAVLPSLL
jgi:Ser/Thr protein kinase RdoA (MazF antagonist)